MGRGRKRPAPVRTEEAASDSDDSEEGQRATLFAKRAKSTGGRVSSFFQAQAGGAGTGRTLADIAGIRDGGDERLLDLAASLPERHVEEKAELRRELEAQFGDWFRQWRAGNSLLFYGFGSKHALLQSFVRDWAQDGACVSVRGLTPGLTAKHILVWAAAAVKQSLWTHYKSLPKQQLLEMIQEEQGRRRVYVLVHNIDGAGLRDPAGQRMLSELAALPNVHLAASFDHVNTPLLWDMQTQDRFSWVWHNATTFAPYTQEVCLAKLPLLLAGKSEEASKESAAVVLASLSHNAREVFRLIADHQLDPGSDQGLSLPALFKLCRERFLVSNEMLLRSFLVEFIDHELLETRKDKDGQELLHIPLQDVLLQAVLEDLDQMG